MTMYSNLVGLTNVDVAKPYRELLEEICKDKTLGILLLDATSTALQKSSKYSSSLEGDDWANENLKRMHSYLISGGFRTSLGVGRGIDFQIFSTRMSK